MDGTVLRINATIPSVPDIEKLETVALSPLSCTDGIDSLLGRAMRPGALKTRTAHRRNMEWTVGGWLDWNALWRWH